MKKSVFYDYRITYNPIRLPLLFFTLTMFLLCNNVNAQCTTSPVYCHPGLGVNKPIVEDLDYFPPTSLAFDSKNRPYMINNNDNNATRAIHTVKTLRDGLWKEYSYLDELEDLYGDSIYPQYPPIPGCTTQSGCAPNYLQDAHRKGSVVIDENDDFYALVSVHRIPSGATTPELRFVVVYADNIASPSWDGEFQIYDVFPNYTINTAFLETRNGNNDFSEYPPLLAYNDSDGVTLVNFKHNSTGDGLTYQTVLLDAKGASFSVHSGGTTPGITKGSRSFITYQTIETYNGKKIHNFSESLTGHQIN